MPYADAGKYDTWSSEWRDICVARWICELETVDLRREWIDKFARRAGRRDEAAVAAFTGQLEDAVAKAWATRKEWRTKGPIAESADAGSRMDPLATSGDTAGAASARGQLSLV